MDNQVEQLTKLHKLYQNGILTEDEFNQKKAEILNTTQKEETIAQGDSKTLKSANQSKPKLWNPNATTLWSLLFTPIFGSLLQSKNWEELGEQEKADNSKNWFYGAIAFVIIAILFIPEKFGAMPSIVFLLLWYFLSGKKQTSYVKEENIDYDKKSWGKPLSIAIAVIFGVVLVLLALIQMGIL